MSLINKMLKDLETRQGGGARAERPIFQDLHSAHSARQLGRRAPVVALVLLLAGVAGIYSWSQWRDNKPTVVSDAAPAIAAAQAPAALEPAPPVPPIVENTPLAPVAAKAPVPAASKPRPVRKRESPAVPPKSVVTAAAGSEAGRGAALRPGSGQARIEKTVVPYSPEEVAENAYQEAARLRRQGDAAGAERQLRTLLATEPKHVKARELLSGLQIENGRVLDAQETLEQSVALLPAHLGFRYLLARLYLERGELVLAVNVLEAARRPGLSDPELSAFLAAVYQRAGRHADAVRSYQDALTARPLEGRWWVGLGISLETQKDNDAARIAYRNGLDTGRLTSNLVQYAEARVKALTPR